MYLFPDLLLNKYFYLFYWTQLAVCGYNSQKADDVAKLSH